MSEMVFDKIQVGRETTVGTPVAATKGLPCKAEAPALDRSYRDPEEDWGRLGDAQPGRGTYGTRGATTRLTSDLSFETIMDFLEMHGAGTITPTGVNPYTWTYTFDTTSLTTKPYTIEIGSETSQDNYRLTSCVVDELVIGFDALTAPGNEPWTVEAGVQAIDMSATALTGALSGPSVMETAEGVYTTVSEGATGTAFGSLSAMTSTLVNFKATSTMPFVRRIYGGTLDTGTAWGLSAQPGIVFEAGLKVSSTTKTATFDNFTAAGATATERRWRVRNSGSGAKTFTIDARVRYKVVGRADRDGEAIYGIQGVMVYDSTLGSRVQMVSAGTAVASL